MAKSRRIEDIAKKLNKRKKGGLSKGDEKFESVKKSSKVYETDESIPIERVLSNYLQQEFDFEKAGDLNEEEMRAAMRAKVISLMPRDNRTYRLNKQEKEKLCRRVLDNVLGLGPLEEIISDPLITDIMINHAKQIYCERKGTMILHEVTFEDNAQLMMVIERIVSAVGRQVNEQNPLCDARMLDGSRFNAIIPPCALDGPCVSIRRFPKAITADQLIGWHSMPPEMMEVLEACVKAKMNIAISGGTGSGKTTLLNVMSSFIPDDERIITIEDSAELQLQQEHVVRLESRPANQEGVGAVHAGDLLVHSLRMRPNRIILGEIRGGEAVDMLQAMNSGNSGSMATVHSNSPVDAISRFETMVAIGMPNMSEKFIRSLIASALDMVVQLNRLSDGSRRCTHIAEITGMEGLVVTQQNLFVFRQTDVDDVKGILQGRFEPTGFKPNFLEDFRKLGYDLADHLFDWEYKVDNRTTMYKLTDEMREAERQAAIDKRQAEINARKAKRAAERQERRDKAEAEDASGEGGGRRRRGKKGKRRRRRDEPEELVSAPPEPETPPAPPVYEPPEQEDGPEAEAAASDEESTADEAGAEEEEEEKAELKPVKKRGLAALTGKSSRGLGAHLKRRK